MSDFEKKYLESLDYSMQERIEEYLDELELPYNDKCIQAIQSDWIFEHQASIEVCHDDGDVFEIDSEDVSSYWMSFVKKMMDEAAQEGELNETSK
ncbi:MAG: hypothetical protein Q4B26_19815 [Eubacteriales bacterium]|nr:hypothetical protein [Eubacteriales bacterium]